LSYGRKRVFRSNVAAFSRSGGGALRLHSGDEGADEPRSCGPFYRRLGEFSHQPTQGEIGRPAPLHQPITMLSRNLPRLIATDLVRLDAAGFAKSLDQQDGRADAHAKLCRRLMARQAALEDSPNHTLSKVK